MNGFRPCSIAVLPLVLVKQLHQHWIKVHMEFRWLGAGDSRHGHLLVPVYPTWVVLAKCMPTCYTGLINHRIAGTRGEESIMRCVCGNYHLTTQDRLRAHPDADPTPTSAELMSATGVRNILAATVAAIPEPRVIDRDWCWRCSVTGCGRDHTPKPKNRLPRFD